MIDDLELTIWQEVNKCRTVAEIKAVLKHHFPNGIMGRSEPFSLPEMEYCIDRFYQRLIDGKEIDALPTRMYGIRQQVFFISMQPDRGAKFPHP